MAESWPTSMVVPPFVMMSFEPTKSTNTILKYTHSCMSGELSATTRSACVKSPRMLSLAAVNFFVS